MIINSWYYNSAHIIRNIWYYISVHVIRHSTIVLSMWKADFMTPSEQLFKELNWLHVPFPKRVQYHTCLTVYKSMTGQAPECTSSLLTHVSDHHERQTMSTTLDLLHIPRSHSANFDRAFSVQSPKLWNSLPADIRNNKSVNRFKSQLKRYLLYNN